MTAAMVAQVAVVEPEITFLAAALKMQLRDNPAGQRAVDRAVEQLAGNPIYEFDGVELRIVSHSRGAAVWHVTDGVSCTCESKHREWCRHRAVYRLLFAQAALAQPALLRAKILEQYAPVDVGDMPEHFLDYDFAA